MWFKLYLTPNSNHSKQNRLDYQPHFRKRYLASGTRETGEIDAKNGKKSVLFIDNFSGAL